MLFTGSVTAGPGILAGVVIGTLIGTGTALIQPHVRQPWSVLVNSASPWLLGGYAAGAVPAGRRAAAAAGLATLVSEVAAYFLAAAVSGIPVSHDYALFWLACALAGGPPCGWAGWAWRRGARRFRAAGAAFPAGTFIAEALGAYGLRLHYSPAIELFLAIGAAMLVLAAGPVLTLRLAGGPGVLAWTAFFAVAGMLIFGPLLNAVVGVNSGGVDFPRSARTPSPGISGFPQQNMRAVVGLPPGPLAIFPVISTPAGRPRDSGILACGPYIRIFPPARVPGMPCACLFERLSLQNPGTIESTGAIQPVINAYIRIIRND